jgi:hypothetical protein
MLGVVFYSEAIIFFQIKTCKLWNLSNLGITLKNHQINHYQ